jgi:hypothetical protein
LLTAIEFDDENLRRRSGQRTADEGRIQMGA